MIDLEVAEALQPALCTAIASLIDDELEAIITRRDPAEYEVFASRLQVLGADISTLASGMMVVARRRNADV